MGCRTLARHAASAQRGTRYPACAHAGGKSSHRPRIAPSRSTTRLSACITLRIADDKLRTTSFAARQQVGQRRFQLLDQPGADVLLFQARLDGDRIVVGTGTVLGLPSMFELRVARDTLDNVTGRCRPRSPPHVLANAQGASRGLTLRSRDHHPRGVWA
jgi:hypothetical protein